MRIAGLVRLDHNKYSVNASAVGRPVDIHAYADRVVIRQNGRVVADHARCYGRGETIYDPWHYVPVLARKPGALGNGAPFKDWVLPAALERVRRKNVESGADAGPTAPARKSQCPIGAFRSMQPVNMSAAVPKPVRSKS